MDFFDNDNMSWADYDGSGDVDSAENYLGLEILAKMIEKIRTLITIQMTWMTWNLMSATKQDQKITTTTIYH